MTQEAIRRSEKLYTLLLKLYPKPFRQQFGEEMRLVFSESLQDAYAQDSGKGMVRLWGRTTVDLCRSLVVEHVQNQKGQIAMKWSLATRPLPAALIGVLLFLPFVSLNLIVGNRIEPFFSLIRPAAHTSRFEYALLITAILLILAGALIAILPIAQKGPDGRRKLYLVNGVLGVLLLAVFVLIALALGEEFYRCDVLQIPNCD